MRRVTFTPGRSAGSRLGWLILILILGFVCSIPAQAEEYPGVYTSDDSLVFIRSSDGFDALEGIVILSYEYSMDWVITSGRLGVKTDAGLLITDGHQYVYNADGTRRSEMEFSSAEHTINWEEMEYQSLPEYGYFLAPMVRGGLAYSLVETSAGLPSQLVLAGEAYEHGQTINLFEGYIYQLSEGVLTAQIAFTEVAFGTQGLVRGNFPEDFPPPPEDYPVTYPEYPTPNYPPPTGGTQPPNYTPTSGPLDSSLPTGRELTPEEISDRPYFTLEPMHDYDFPPLERVGIVAIQSRAAIEGYEPLCDEVLQTLVSDNGGVEVVYIPWDEAKLGGAVIYDRASWLCDEYGVDALMLSELEKLNIPGDIGMGVYTSSFRVNAEVSSKLIEGFGGTIVWDTEHEIQRIHDPFEANDGIEKVLREDLVYLLNDLIEDLIANGALEGGHVD